MKDILGLPYLPINASAHGVIVDDVNIIVHWLMLGLFLGWSAYFVYVLIRFRASTQPKAVYEGGEGHFFQIC